MNHKCRSGKHEWADQEYAELCCNGFFNWLKIPRKYRYHRAINKMHDFLYRHHLGFLCWEFMWFGDRSTKPPWRQMFKQIFNISGASGTYESRQLNTPFGTLNVLYQKQSFFDAAEAYRKKREAEQTNVDKAC